MRWLRSTARGQGAKAHPVQGHFLTLFFLGVFYTFVTWAFVNGYGIDRVAQGVNAQFEGKVASAWYPLTDRYVGSALTTLFELLIITSAFACGLAFFNTASRYVFALGRERILPAALGRTHPTHRTPHLASLAVAAFAALWVLTFYLDDSSVEASLLKLATWTPLVGVFGLLLVQARACPSSSTGRGSSSACSRSASPPA